MSKQQDALRLALEALELAQDNLRPHGDNCFLHDEGEYNSCFCGKDSLSDHLQSVVEKLDEALAQPQQKIEYCTNYYCAGDCGQPHNQKEMREFLASQPQQEPVAWVLLRQDEDGFEPIQFYGGKQKPEGDFKDRFALRPVCFADAAPQPAQHKPLTPDMFWNQDDAETPYDSIEEFLNHEICNGYLEVGAVFTLLQAKRFPSVKIKVTSIDEYEFEAEYEIIEGATHEIST